jgi:predicted Zn-ribbon and HTH transcriptional regulator
MSLEVRRPASEEDRPSTTNDHQAAAKLLDSHRVPPTTRGMAKADLIVWVEALLNGPARCTDCGRPLYNIRSVAAGRGPVCRSKLSGRGGAS